MNRKYGFGAENKVIEESGMSIRNLNLFLAVHPLVMGCYGVFEGISVGIFAGTENADADNLVDMKSLAV